MKKQLLSATIVTLLLSGCATQESGKVAAQESINIKPTNAIPGWVMNPVSANGYAASNCVAFSGNFSVDRNHAVSLARNTLAQNMDLKASVLEKTYQKMDSAAGTTSTGTSFEQVAKQISSVSIKQSQVEKVEIVNIAGTDQVCALVTIPKVASEKIFDNVIATGSIDPDDKDALYKEFISQKTTNELESQVQTLSKTAEVKTEE